MGKRQPDFDVATEVKAFYQMLTPGSKQYPELKAALPDTVDMDMFVRVAKTAVQRNVELLTPAWRSSLLLSLSKAAIQGLPPDGKHGALIARWDAEAGQKQVCWQPMVWGITKLGRLTGEIKTINAQIVFEGENFEVEGGDELVITHKINPQIVDAAYAHLDALTRQSGDDRNGPPQSGPSGPSPLEKFWDQVVAAYCVITSKDGTKTRRWMSRSRLLRVRESSKAGRGPWSGPFLDEMILKTTILFTCKWIDTDIDTPAMRRFRAALEEDMEVDFDRVSGGAAAPAIPASSSPPALTDQTSKIDTLAEQMAKVQREKAPVETPSSDPGTTEHQTAGDERAPDEAADKKVLADRRAAEWVSAQKLLIGSMSGAEQVCQHQQTEAYQRGADWLRRSGRAALLDDLARFAEDVATRNSDEQEAA